MRLNTYNGDERGVKEMKPNAFDTQSFGEDHYQRIAITVQRYYLMNLSP